MPNRAPVLRVLRPSLRRFRQIDERPSSTDRGYDANWKALRDLVVSEEPLCRLCADHGRVTPTDMVDHIIPIKGPDDPLRLDRANCQGLCWKCHGVKTEQDRKKGLLRNDARR